MPDANALHEMLDDEVHRHGPGLFALVLDHGEPVFEASAGVADLATGRQIERADRFRIGSVTKTFVTALVLQLVADGVLSLAQSVERWLPGLVPSGERITIDRLLRMRSGLPDYTAPVLGDPFDLTALQRYWSPRDLVRAALDFEDPIEPDLEYRYNNTDYVLLGMIVEAATGQSAEAQLWQRLLGPLKLEGTTLPNVDPELRGPHADGHLREKPDQPYHAFTAVTPSESYTAGAMISTPLDLARFFEALFTGQVLDAAGLAAMIDCTQVLDHRCSRGRGMTRYDFSGTTVYGHHGGMPGFTTLALRSTTGRTLVMYQNGLDFTDILTSDIPFVAAVFEADLRKH